MALVAVQNKGPGAVAAVGKAGVLLSEVVAGRGSPGVIVGTSVEIGVDLLVKHPVVRPFASTLAAQTNALIQLGEALKVANDTGNTLDKARAMRMEQVQKTNTIIWLLKKNLAFLEGYSAPEVGLVLTTAQDPFAKFREKTKAE